MTRNIHTAIAALAVLTSATTHTIAAENTSCAVVTFDNAGEATSGEAGMLANMVSVNTARSGNYKVIPRYKVNATLRKRRFSIDSFSSASAGGLTAGRMLNADLVIFGTYTRNGDKNEVSAMLLDVKAQKVIDRVQVAASGDASSFRRTAATEIVRKLSGQPATVAQARNFNRIEPPKEEEPAKPAIRKAQPAPKPIKPIPAPVKPVTQPTLRPLQSAPSASVEPGQPFSEYLSEKWAIASKNAAHQWENFKRYSRGKLDVGIRYRTISLDKETDESFLGTINTLDQENDGLPAELFATWYFTEYIGAELSWFNLRARTVSNPEGFSDGAIVVSGPTFAVTGKYEDYAPWIPFATLGIGLFSSEFDTEDWWGYGYESIEAWEAEGSPSFSIANRFRNLDLEDATGRFIVLGVRYQTDEQWSFELAYRRMSLSTESKYTIDAPDGLRDRGTNDWPLDNSSWLIGARYTF